MVQDILDSARRHPNGRRIFTSEQKALIVSEWEKSGMSGPEYSRHVGILVSILYKWRKDAMRGATMSIQNDGDLYTKAQLDSLQKENEELKKALAESHLDVRILKKKLELDAQKQRLKKSANLGRSSR